MISANEKKKMLAVSLCGEKVIERLESIGVKKLSDLKDKNPFDLMEKINIAAGHIIWRPPMAVVALTNLIKAAKAGGKKETKPEK